MDVPGERYAVLLYTARPDAEGTLGGLVQEPRRIDDHVAYALLAAAPCSSDPVCAEHVPGHSMEERWLHGAACHGCTLIAETSCEMRSGTRYVVVGGVATVLHGYARLIAAVDLILDLIHLKRLADRPQDREDVAKLEEILRLKGGAR